MKEIAIVTGGSAGLGYCIAQELITREMDVCLIGRKEQKLQQAQIQLEKKKQKGEIIYFAGDVSDETFVKTIFSELKMEGRHINYLFNNAGVGNFGCAEDNTKDRIDINFNASLTGLILMSSNALKAMKGDNGGTIVNIMSTAALKGNPNESVYCAAKWGAKGFTESIKAETKNSNIKVIGVYPGGLKTGFWSPECGMMPNVATFMEPEEVAEVIVHTVMERNSMYVTDITIDRK